MVSLTDLLKVDLEILNNHKNTNMENKNIIMNAWHIARRQHTGQFRKFGAKQEYIEHPLRVFRLLREVGIIDRDVLAASLLHDTIEDTVNTIEERKRLEDEIRENCGKKVLNLVWELTFPSSTIEFKKEYSAASRIYKHKINMQHLINVSSIAKVIKLADRIDNLRDFKALPIKFLGKYIDESNDILVICRDTYTVLEDRLENIVDESEKHFNSKY